jgi:uncharacterized protein (DUF58 family)
MLENLRRKMVRENRIYIMPSGRGVIFLGAVFVMILTGATYNNNLIFILAALLFAVFCVSMVQTHYNIKGVRLEFLNADENFEGRNLSLLFQIVQKRARHKQALQIRLLSKHFKTISKSSENLLPAERAKSARIEVEAWRRGVHSLPDVVLETYYPYGLFRAWKVFRGRGRLVVYPRPESSVRLEAAPLAAGEAEVGARHSPEGDFGELKPYRMGESYRQISWKHYARSNELFSKIHWGEEHKHYRIPWDERVDRETQLRRMSRWIEVALNENATFEMETGDLKIETGFGLDQARTCWRALAEIERAS